MRGNTACENGARLFHLDKGAGGFYVVMWEVGGGAFLLERVEVVAVNSSREDYRIAIDQLFEACDT